MTSAFIKSIKAEGLFGRFDFEHKFDEGINIVYGANGAGKTTLLHILANALSGDFARFNNLDFEKITIKFSDKRTLIIISEKVDDAKTGIIATINKEKIYPKNHLGFAGKTFEILSRLQAASSSKIDLVETQTSPLKTESIPSRVEAFLQKFNSKSSKDLLENEDFLKLYSELNEKTGNPELLSVAYFPAFRTMIEAWAATNIGKDSRGVRLSPKVVSEEWKSKATEQARDWFGEFTPTVNFPSLVDIEEQLTSEILKARIVVGNKDRDLLSQAFLKVFASLSDHSSITEKGDEILKQIQELFSKLEALPMGTTSTPVYKELSQELSRLHTKEGVLESSAVRILKIYREVLESSFLQQVGSFASIEKYIGSVNEFLGNKKSLAYKLDSSSQRQRWLGVRFEDGSFTSGLRTLSSGERQIITLIYASTHMSQQNIVLIDEPEISLNIDWQRKLISKMSEHIGERQIIACTHSPVIAADYQDNLKEFQFKPSNSKTLLISENTENEGYES